MPVGCGNRPYTATCDFSTPPHLQRYFVILLLQQQHVNSQKQILEFNQIVVILQIRWLQTSSIIHVNDLLLHQKSKSLISIVFSLGTFQIKTKHMTAIFNLRPSDFSKFGAHVDPVNVSKNAKF
jgi:hypothetical protein